MTVIRMLIGVLVGVLLLFSASMAESKVEIAPVFGLQYGEIGYESVKLAGGGVTLGSELIFPLDYVVLGAQVRYLTFENTQPGWVFDLKGCLGVTDPRGYFTDRDWLGYRPGLETNFSYSVSNVKGSSVQLDFQAKRVVSSTENFDLGIFVALGYEKISQEATDLSIGVFIETVADTFFFDGGRFDGLSLKYDLKYFYPAIGLAPDLRISDRVSLSAQAAFTPLLKMTDKDDHVLRNFTVESSGRGTGFFSDASLRILLGRPEQQRRLFFELFGSFRAVHADLDATIEFYADNTDEGYQKGDRFENDPHEISGHQIQGGIRLGVPLR